MQGKYCFVVPSNIEAAACVLSFLWLTKKEDITTIVSSENNLQNDLEKIKLDSFKFVYIVGFYDFKNFNRVYDRKNVYIINKKITNMPSFSQARIITDGDTTLDLLINLLQKHTENKFSNNQEIFLDNIKKYLTFTFDNDLIPLKLFYYFKTQPDMNKVDAFIRKFNSGLILFSETENYKINLLLKELAITLKSLKLFKGTLNYNNKTLSVVSTFSAKFKNEVAHKILKKGFDISLVLDLEKKTAHFRKSKGIDIDLGDYVHKCFSGYGTEYAAFCKLNEQIIDLTKNFFPLNEH